MKNLLLQNGGRMKYVLYKTINIYASEPSTVRKSDWKREESYIFWS